MNRDINFPPDFDFSRLTVRAAIDYVTMAIKEPVVREFTGDGYPQWLDDPEDQDIVRLKIRDPSIGDLVQVCNFSSSVVVMECRVAIDFWPTAICSSAGRRALMEQTLKAIVGRMRPEDACPYGFMMRGVVICPNEAPELYDRIPPHQTELRWGMDGEWIQVAAFKKVTEQGALILPSDRRVRVHVTLRRGALIDMELNTPLAIAYADWRRLLAPYFQMIARPEPLGSKCMEPSRSLRASVVRSWSRAGAAGFKPAVVPAEQGRLARDAMHELGRQLHSVKSVRLVPHRRANELVGNALKQLTRRMLRGAKSGLPRSQPARAK
jgi:hypothetical protein